MKHHSILFSGKFATKYKESRKFIFLAKSLAESYSDLSNNFKILDYSS